MEILYRTAKQDSMKDGGITFQGHPKVKAIFESLVSKSVQVGRWLCIAVKQMMQIWQVAHSPAVDAVSNNAHHLLSNSIFDFEAQLHCLHEEHAESQFVATEAMGACRELLVREPHHIPACFILSTTLKLGQICSSINCMTRLDLLWPAAGGGIKRSQL